MLKYYGIMFKGKLCVCGVCVYVGVGEGRVGGGGESIVFINTFWFLVFQR